MNDELVFVTYVNQLITEQLLNRPSALKQLHMKKTMLAVLVNDGRMGDAVTNSIWFMKQGDLKTTKRKALKTALWTRPDNPLADIVQIGGHSVETVRNIMHGLFVQFEVGDHSFERVDFLTFKDQHHLNETPKQTRKHLRSNLKRHILLMLMMQRLLRSKYGWPLMGMQAIYAENATEAASVRGDSIELYDQLINAATLILEETRVLLPMYHKALFSDSAYVTIMKAS